MRIKRLLRKGLVWALAGLLIVVLAGCRLEQFRVQSARAGQIVVSSLSDPRTFNPVISQEVSPVFGYLFEGLVTTNGLTGEIEPDLAESWQVSEDGQQIIFTLRAGLKWSDGEPLTVDDVVFTYNDLYLNPDIPTDARDILRVGEEGTLPTISKIDGRRVALRVSEPFAPFLRNAGVPILPRHILEVSVREKDPEGRSRFLGMWGTDSNPQDIVGSGPYRMVNYATSQRVVLERNPYYWRRDDQGQPQPYIERMVVQIVESADTALIQFRSRGLDLLSVSPEYFSLLKREEDRLDFSIYEGGPTLSSSFISFNLNKGRRNGRPLVDPIKSRWFNTVAFRQAVAYAINRQQMLNNIFQGIGEPENSPIPVQSPYYLAPEDGLRTYDYDPDKARELLLGAGFTYNSSGQLLDAEGNRVRFTLMTNAGNKIREAMGAQIRQDLSRMGMQVDFTPIAFNTLVERLSNSLQFECYLLGFSGGGVEPNSSANIWRVDGGLHNFNQQPRPGQPPLEGREVADWEAQIDQLYIDGAQTLDEDERKEIYGRAQMLVQENLPFIYLINPLSMTAVSNKIQGVQYSALGGALWNIHELQLQE
ncbi:ABC transporter substrate-binding protein [Synechococcales cyanobacterium C]|uniref:ABC transporter substrate-binding protein n=1 Tax=Petrachloros mirabilis ULC683 TaxID=2781853 RepID=A0A8K2A827_9CYAN|nr:ABC transporter substrate-binding protein [Petrachloros mirabilis]NCJ07536.1 ABC transporter substrate-binding protein [Petrachloros mirabilis ULC683]